MPRHISLLAVAAVALAIASPAARANTIDGSIWENVPGAGDAIPSSVPATPADVTFTVSDPISFASGGLYTIGEFLASGGAIVTSGAGELGNTLDNTIFNFEGLVSVTTGETFTVGHDDGLTLTIGGTTVISDPGPTAFVVTTETYNGPSGNLPFQLVYGECCGPPGDLSISLPLQSLPVPEPASLGLLGIGIGGLAFVRRQRRR